MRLDVPAIGIIRGIAGDFFQEVMHVSFAAGLQALEITMNTEGAPDIVASCRPLVPEGKLLGVGTVRNREEARIAFEAGAMFLVTPNSDTRVIEYAADRDVPVIAGAFTPTEVYNAWAAGAAMVKIFPCGIGGPAYIRELRGPFDQIPMVAVGGVTLKNLRDYFRAGVAGVGVGSALFGAEALQEQNLGKISANVGEFVRVLGETVSDTSRRKRQ
jgi:2-dehydro-3-deoxyphosphogluconate aldolase/(4S)-4-hydroxy-2-oxoglutarate aldolase